MSDVCSYLLAQELDVNCDDPIVSGLEATGVIINRAEIDFDKSVLSDNNTIKSIALVDGAKAYKVMQQGSTPFTGTTTELVAGTYRNSFTNTVALVVFNNGPEVCANIIDKLANGEFVIILENKFKGLGNTTTPGGAAFQVFGWYQGCKASEITAEKYSDDTDGGWAVTLQETKAPKSGLFLFDTGYSATKAIVESLTD